MTFLTRAADVLKVKLMRDRGPIKPPHTGAVINFPPTELEHRLGLHLKLFEEAAEVLDHPGDVDEYADVLQVLTDLAHLNGISYQEIEIARTRKLHDRGGFTNGLVFTRKMEVENRP